MKINEKIICIFILSLTALSNNMGCGFSADKSGDVITTTNIITGSYNTNKTTCDFTSAKTFDGDGNISGCNFTNKCDGDVRTTDFIDVNEKDFFAKCINPEEELPIPEEPTTPPSTISSSF